MQSYPEGSLVYKGKNIKVKKIYELNKPGGIKIDIKSKWKPCDSKVFLTLQSLESHITCGSN